MKSLILSGALVLSILITISGCQKDVSTGGNFTDSTGTGTTTANPTLLKHFILLEGTDTLEKRDYTYDNSGRSIKNHEFEYFGNTAKFEYTLLLSYNTNDSLQSKVVYYDHDLVNNTTDSAKEFFIYDASGKIKTDSLIENNNSALVYYYAFLPAYINMTTNFGELQHIYQTFTGGNLSFEKDSVFQNGFVDSVATHTGSYDTHPNPFARIEVKRNVWFNVENAEQDYSMFPHKNNPVDETFVWPANGSDYHTTYLYIYNNAGYPASVIINDVVNGYIYKGIYIYQ